jgi:CRISPR system Cascade subunit CasE
MTRLARLQLSPGSRILVRDLGDVVRMHNRVMSAFPHSCAGNARAELGVLWRVDQPSGRPPTIFVQSAVEGDWNRLPQGWASRVETKGLDDFFAGFAGGMRLRFRLRANATRRIETKSDPGGPRRNGRRVPLRDPEAAVAWLSRHGTDSGFQLVKGDVVPMATASAEAPISGRRQGSIVTVEATLFEGLLAVTDPDRLRHAVRAGLGPAKAYGCGLLSLGRPR